MGILGYRLSKPYDYSFIEESNYRENVDTATSDLPVLVYDIDPTDRCYYIVIPGASTTALFYEIKDGVKTAISQIPYPLRLLCISNGNANPVQLTFNFSPANFYMILYIPAQTTLTLNMILWPGISITSGANPTGVHMYAELKK